MGVNGVRVGILGPLEVRDAAGRPMALTGPRLRTLLVRLAVAGGEPGARQGPGLAEALLQPPGLDHAAHRASFVALMLWFMSTASQAPLTGPGQHADR
ncbi:MAG: hypothetical protein ACLPKE_22705 [Streptosporangiaceae bacterium]